jgi:hypothetical protein
MVQYTGSRDFLVCRCYLTTSNVNAIVVSQTLLPLNTPTRVELSAEETVVVLSNMQCILAGEYVF